MSLLRIRLLATSLFLLLAISTPAPAGGHLPAGLFKGGPANGKIKGLILDANKARVANATVKVWNGRMERKAKSSGEGEFEIELAAGDYRVTVEAEGFRRYVSLWLKVGPGETKALSVSLTVAEPQEPIPVS